jgi:hypothetical protein
MLGRWRIRYRRAAFDKNMSGLECVPLNMTSREALG